MKKWCKYSLPPRAAGDIAMGGVKTEGLGDVKKGAKWTMKERPINKRWLFIPNKAECRPHSLGVQRLHLGLLSFSNYWLAEAFEKRTINPGIWEKKQRKTAACFLPGTVIDEALRNNTPTDASNPTVNYGIPACCFQIFPQSAARTIVINDYKIKLHLKVCLIAQPDQHKNRPTYWVHS